MSGAAFRPRAEDFASTAPAPSAVLVHGVPDGEFEEDLKQTFEAIPGITVLVTECRPTLAGARITARRLLEASITPTVITDNMIARCLQRFSIREAYLFYHRIGPEGAICRTGSLTVACLADDFGTAAVLYPAGVEETPSPEAEDVRFLDGVRIAPVSVEAYREPEELVPWRLLKGIRTAEGAFATSYEELPPRRWTI